MTTGSAERMREACIENYHIESIRAADLRADQGAAQGTDPKWTDPGGRDTPLHQTACEGGWRQCDYHHPRVQ